MAELTEVDHRRAWAVRRYGERRTSLAASRLGEPLLSSFRNFCRHWAEQYDWSNPELLGAYLRLTFEERRELYRRFARECRSWEATLRYANSPFPPRPEPPPRPEARPDDDRQRLHRKLREMEEREARSRLFYERLRQEVADQARALRLPWQVRDAFRLLGLPAGAPLEVVRKEYRRLALVYHPDRRGDHVAMSELNRAYRHILDHYRTR